jgi:hypothetical protein
MLYYVKKNRSQPGELPLQLPLPPPTSVIITDKTITFANENGVTDRVIYDTAHARALLIFLRGVTIKESIRVGEPHLLTGISSGMFTSTTRLEETLCPWSSETKAQWRELATANHVELEAPTIAEEIQFRTQGGESGVLLNQIKERTQSIRDYLESEEFIQDLYG